MMRGNDIGYFPFDDTLARSVMDSHGLLELRLTNILGSTYTQGVILYAPL
jgi:CDP-glycerol glycerophosphotransferase (TagB/SpsB family)